MTDFVDVTSSSWPIADPALWYAYGGSAGRFDQIVAPIIEPILLEDAKLQIRVTGSAENSIITRQIAAARRQCESYTRRSLMPQTWALKADRFPCWGSMVGVWPSSLPTIRLSRPPIATVDSIVYIDPAGVQRTLDPALYQVDLPVGPKAGYGRIAPAVGTSWPDTLWGQMNAVTVTFSTGYPSMTSPMTSPPQQAVPEDLIAGMLILIAELYKTRSMSVNAIQASAMVRIEDCWQPYRLY